MIYKDGTIINSETNRMLSTYIKDGFKFVSLFYNNNQRPYNVAKLVLKTFKNIDKNNDELLIFLDGDRNNVSLDNICYMSISDYRYKLFHETFESLGDGRYKLQNGDIDNEEWKFIYTDIDNLNTKTQFMISNYGRVYNTYSLTFLHPSVTSSNPYPFVVVRVNGISKCIAIHSTVAKYFIYNDDPINKIYVHHNDNNKSNFIYTNLQWVTPSENVQHAIEDGKQKVGEDCCHSKITKDTVIKIISMLKNGYRVTDIMNTLNVSRDIIKHIKFGESWKHITNGETISNGHEIPYTVGEIAEMINMIRNGIDFHEINNKFGIGLTSYYRYKRAMIASDEVEDCIKANVIDLFNKNYDIKYISENVGLKKDTVIDIIYNNIK